MVKLRSTTGRLFGIFLAYLPLRFLIYFIATKWKLPHTNLIELASEIFICLAAVWLVATNLRMIWPKLRDWHHWPLVIKLAVALVAWAIVTLSFTTAGASQAVRGLRLDFLGLGILVTLWLVPVSDQDQSSLFDLARWGLLFIATTGLLELIFGSGYLHVLGFVPYQFFAGKIHQVHGLLPTPNMFGSALVLLVTLLFRQRSRPNLILLTLLGILVGSSFSRSAWLALSILGALIFFANLRHGIFTWGVGLLALGLAGGIGWGTLYYHSGLHTVATHDRSDQQHEVAYKTALTQDRSAETWLVGSGIGTAGPATFKSSMPPRIAESWYIQLLQEVGLIGLGLFIALMVVLARELLASGEPILAYATVALSVNALFLHIWADNRYLSLVFWTLAGLALFSAKRSKKSGTAA